MNRSEGLAATEGLDLAWLLRKRLDVTKATPCAGCGDTMEDEFVDREDDPSEDIFDGVLNDAGQPFHHGCEDF